jgi:hypothetical protein
MGRQGNSAAVSVDRFFQFAILGLVASGYLAVAGSGYLDTPTIALTAAGLAVRALMNAGILRFSIPERAVTFATLVYMGFFAVDYFALSQAFLDATVHLVFFLAVVKVLTAHTNRDYAYVAVIAFLELLAAAILSASLNFFLFLTLYLLFAIAAFTSSEIRRAVARPQAVSRKGLRWFHPRLAVLTVFMSAGILSLTAGLFFMLPRTARAALDQLVSRRIILPGFSNQVTLGQIGQVKASSTPVMHVRPDDLPESRPGLARAKWRGTTLSDFDGRRWSNPTRLDQAVNLQGGQVILTNRIDRPGTHYSYEVNLRPLDTDAVFIAGIPEVLWMRYPTLVRAADDTFRLRRTPSGGLRYQVYAFQEDPRAAELRTDAGPGDAAFLKRYLQLPPLDPRISDLARQMAGAETGSAARARALEAALHKRYGYTLDLPETETRDPLGDFLFVRRKGHCEYFASAMAVMLRSLGIPARLATGFQSGVYNPFTDMYVIRASDAHSWVEAWLPGRGWTTFDPTPPDPSRPFPLLARLGLLMDAAETFWQQWVLGYDLERQGQLAGRVQESSRSFGLEWFESVRAWTARWSAASAADAREYGRAAVLWAVAMGMALWLSPRLLRLIRIRRHVARARLGNASTADATVLYERMLDLLRRRGHQKPLWYTPQEFACALPPELRGVVGEFTEAYNAVRFGGDRQAAPKLSLLLDRLEGKQA